MRTVTFPNGEQVPALGLGTWRMGERPSRRKNEIEALRAGLDLCMSLIDTAEMYGEGGAEEVVAEAIAGRRADVFLVSKVYPHNASTARAIAACERSLKRLKTDRLDLYLLHWRGAIPLDETVAAFERLQKDGKIRFWGVSNFGLSDMNELLALRSGSACAANQVLYHLGERGIEWGVLPECRRWAMPVMAYSPLGQGAILRRPVLDLVARKHGTTPAAVALAWVLREAGVIAIPKSANVLHARENVQALDMELDAEDLASLDKAFPPPTGPKPLAIL